MKHILFIVLILCSMCTYAARVEPNVPSFLMIGNSGVGKTTATNVFAGSMRGKDLLLVKETHSLGTGELFPSSERIAQDREENNIEVTEVQGYENILPENTEHAWQSQTGAIRRFRVQPNTLNEQMPIDILDAPGLYDTRGADTSACVEDSLRDYIYNQPLSAIFLFFDASQLARIGAAEKEKVKKIISFFPQDVIQERVFFFLNFTSRDSVSRFREEIKSICPHLHDEHLNIIEFDLDFVANMYTLSRKEVLTEDEEDDLYLVQRKKDRIYKTSVDILNRVQALQGGMVTHEWRAFNETEKETLDLCQGNVLKCEAGTALVEEIKTYEQKLSRLKTSLTDAEKRVRENKLDQVTKVKQRVSVKDGLQHNFLLNPVHGRNCVNKAETACPFTKKVCIFDNKGAVEEQLAQEKINLCKTHMKINAQEYKCDCGFKIDWDAKNLIAFLLQKKNATPAEMQKALKNIEGYKKTDILNTLLKARKKCDARLVEKFVLVEHVSLGSESHFKKVIQEKDVVNRVTNPAEVEVCDAIEKDVNDILIETLPDLKQRLFIIDYIICEIQTRIKSLTDKIENNYYNKSPENEPMLHALSHVCETNNAYEQVKRDLN